MVNDDPVADATGKDVPASGLKISPTRKPGRPSPGLRARPSRKREGVIRVLQGACLPLDNTLPPGGSRGTSGEGPRRRSSFVDVGWCWVNVTVIAALASARRDRVRPPAKREGVSVPDELAA